MLQKALENNGCDLKAFTEPQWNETTLKRDIERLEKEIEFIRKKAFIGFFAQNHDGVNIEYLQSKILVLKSMKVRLKSLELLK